MFNEKSRYKDLETYEVTDHRGRVVPVVPVPDPPIQVIQGYHLLRQGQRPDHLAAQYLDDGAGFWRICEANETMLPESLSEATEIAIPYKNR
ncbi:MAG: hypothetical protein R2824_25525 [Saprospiraceae bacterium]|nr:hypothetical protein [Lewinella sp.]